jgi:CRISPR-associated protein Cst2
VLRGGAKQAAFGTDIAPRVLISAGLSCGNPIFNNLFTENQNGLVLKKNTLLEIVKDYKDRICTPVYIGMRSGFLGNEQDVRTLDCTTYEGVKFVVDTPIGVANQMSGNKELDKKMIEYGVGEDAKESFTHKL